MRTDKKEGNEGGMNTSCVYCTSLSNQEAPIASGQNQVSQTIPVEI